MNTTQPKLLHPLAKALALTWCISCVAAPTPEELLDTGFRTPAQAFGTLQTAVAGDHVDMGYRCFTDGFKSNNGLDNMVWQAAWEQMLDETPSMRYISEAEIISQRDLSPTSIELIVEVNKFFNTVRARITLVREDFFEAYRGDTVYFDGFRPFDDYIFVQEDAPADVVTYITVPEGKNKDEITEIRIGQDWHIDSFQIIDSSTAPPQTP